MAAVVFKEKTMVATFSYISTMFVISWDSKSYNCFLNQVFAHVFLQGRRFVTIFGWVCSVMELKVV